MFVRFNFVEVSTLRNFLTPAGEMLRCESNRHNLHNRNAMSVKTER